MNIKVTEEQYEKLSKGNAELFVDILNKRCPFKAPEEIEVTNEKIQRQCTSDCALYSLSEDVQAGRLVLELCHNKVYYITKV